MNTDIGVISVISSAVVAIASLLIPLVFGIINDSKKWKRETKAAERQQIDQKTVELLEILSQFRSGHVAEAARATIAETYSKALGRYYAWERVIWSICRGVNQERLKRLRERFENGYKDSSYFFDKTPILADEILSIAQIAREIIK